MPRFHQVITFAITAVETESLEGIKHAIKTANFAKQKKFICGFTPWQQQHIYIFTFLNNIFLCRFFFLSSTTDQKNWSNEQVFSKYRAGSGQFFCWCKKEDMAPFEHASCLRILRHYWHSSGTMSFSETLKRDLPTHVCPPFFKL